MEKRTQIIEAKTSEIKDIKPFKDIFNETTGEFDYINYYMEKYGKDIDQNVLLNKLSKEHDELNYISYYNYLNETFDINDLEEDEIKKINFLIPIFKSIFLERLITKRDKMDIIRFFILTEKELIIYPPENYSNINYINLFNDIYDIYYDIMEICKDYKNDGMYVYNESLGDYQYIPYPNYYSCVSHYTSLIFYYFDDLYFELNFKKFNDLIYSICIP